MTEIAEVGLKAEQVTITKFLTMIEDFGTMSTGRFREKYPDCGSFEGFGYIQRKARSVSRRTIFKGVPTHD